MRRLRSQIAFAKAPGCGRESGLHARTHFHSEKITSKNTCVEELGRETDPVEVSKRCISFVLPAAALLPTICCTCADRLIKVMSIVSISVERLTTCSSSAEASSDGASLLGQNCNAKARAVSPSWQKVRQQLRRNKQIDKTNL